MTAAAVKLLEKQLNTLRESARERERHAASLMEAAHGVQEKALKDRQEAEQIGQALDRLLAVERGTALG